jgi:ABC-type multidrug transport system fused ATPase/permease subunit
VLCLLLRDSPTQRDECGYQMLLCLSVCRSVVILDHRPPPPFFSPARAQGVRGRASQLDEREGMGRRGHTPRSCRGIVSFEEVHFAFPTRAQLPVLRGVSFTVREGEVCAIVGPSGGEARTEGGPVRAGRGGGTGRGGAEGAQY